jgi:hypothetical protein
LSHRLSRQDACDGQNRKDECGEAHERHTRNVRIV